MCSKFLFALSLAILLPALQVQQKFVWAHAYPAVSVPNNGATVREPPREVRIQFTEGIEFAFSQMIVKEPNGEVVSQGKLRKLADDTVAIDLKLLGPGNYSVQWQVLSVDTHVTDGTLRFTVSPAGK